MLILKLATSYKPDLDGVSGIVRLQPDSTVNPRQYAWRLIRTSGRCSYEPSLRVRSRGISASPSNSLDCLLH